MDTQNIKSLAELKAEVLAKRQAQEQKAAELEQEQHQRKADAWRALLVSLETELHPELYAALDRNTPGDFTAQTEYQPVTFRLPRHSRILAAFRFAREPELGWKQCKFANPSWAWWMVEERYYYMDDQYNTTWREYSDLGEALLAAENEGNKIAKREQDEREQDERGRVETARRQAEVRASVEATAIWTEDKPAPEPAPAEVLVDALDAYLHSFLARNGYVPNV